MTKKTRSSKKRKMNLASFTTKLLLVAVVSFLGSKLFLRTVNNDLSTRKQKMETEIAALQVQNDAVAVEISTLNSRERVNGIAAENGLSLDQGNIVTITKTDGE